MSEKYSNELNKLINRFIFQSRNFVDYACFPYGLLDLVVHNVKSDKFISDFEYFSFTKSTKTLISIRMLLKDNQNEDAMILLRSIFENYISTRYLHEGPDGIDDFVINPINVVLAFYNVVDGGVIKNRNNENVGVQKNPSKFKIGEDKKYYNEFYDILSRFSHCNYGLVDYYMDRGDYSINKINDSLLIRFFVVFVFSKIFELVVTVVGEDFPNKRIEKACYDLVIDSLKLQSDVLNYLLSTYEEDKRENMKHYNKRMKKMLKNMKKSLKEEIGSIKK